MRISRFFFVLLFSSLPCFAAEGIKSLKPLVKQKTQVMVLGTAHLSSLPGELDMSSVNAVIAAFNPTQIAVETLRGEDVIAMLNGAPAYKSTVEQFIGSEMLNVSRAQQKALGITAAEAIAEMRVLLNKDSISPSQRLSLIRNSIAGYYYYTAVLHWLLLEDSAREALPEKLHEVLTAQGEKNNESIQLGVEMAKAKGINEIHPIDDHLDKDMYDAMLERLMPSYNQSETGEMIASSKMIIEYKRLTQLGSETGDWLPLYQWLNSTAHDDLVINVEWRSFVDKDLEVGPALERVALWEIRNLNIASNIMRVVARDIGGRVVVIIGASHKIFLEEYLEKMIGVEVVSFSDYVN